MPQWLFSLAWGESQLKKKKNSDKHMQQKPDALYKGKPKMADEVEINSDAVKPVQTTTSVRQPSV